MVADIEELQEMDASEFHARRLNAKGVLTPERSGNFVFTVADGTVKIFGRGQRLRTSTLFQDRPERGEEQEILQGNSCEWYTPSHLQEDSTRDDEDAKHDFSQQRKATPPKGGEGQAAKQQRKKPPLPKGGEVKQQTPPKGGGNLAAPRKKERRKAVPPKGGEGRQHHPTEERGKTTPLKEGRDQAAPPNRGEWKCSRTQRR